MTNIPHDDYLVQPAYIRRRLNNLSTAYEGSDEELARALMGIRQFAGADYEGLLQTLDCLNAELRNIGVTVARGETAADVATRFPANLDLHSALHRVGDYFKRCVLRAEHRVRRANAGNTISDKQTNQPTEQ